MSTRYPPIPHPIAETNSLLVTRPWAHWFQQWATLVVDLATEVTGRLLRANMQTQAAGTLLGRGTSGEGSPEVITVGAGLTMSGTTLSSTAAALYYEPLTTGIVAAPELIFALGDVIMVEVYL